MWPTDPPTRRKMSPGMGATRPQGRSNLPIANLLVLRFKWSVWPWRGFEGGVLMLLVRFESSQTVEHGHG